MDQEEEDSGSGQGDTMEKEKGNDLVVKEFLQQVQSMRESLMRQEDEIRRLRGEKSMVSGGSKEKEEKEKRTTAVVTEVDLDVQKDGNLDVEKDEGKVVKMGKETFKGKLPKLNVSTQSDQRKIYDCLDDFLQRLSKAEV